VYKVIKSGEAKLGLEGEFQKVNATIAVAVAQQFLRKANFLFGPADYQICLDGLANTKWPGRCDVRHEPGTKWCIDGGHTLDSIKVAADWYAGHISNSDSTQSRPKSYLVFNQQTRDATSLASHLHETLSHTLGYSTPFEQAIFCTNTTYKDAGFKPDLISVNTNKDDVDEMKVQKALATAWADIDPKSEVKVERTIEEAVATVRQDSLEQGREKVVLVTGSLHLVGGLLEVLEGGK
jgi:folylpolyglutamate synthase